MPEPIKVPEFVVPLNEKEQIVHKLAAAMLKTRYDPAKCNRSKKTKT